MDGIRAVPIEAQICRLAVAESPDGGNDLIGMHRRLLATLVDRLLDQLHGVLGQQLQDPNVLPRSAGESVAGLEVGPQLLEAGRQGPLIEHEGVIQGRRTATEDRQIVPGLDDPFVPGIAALMAGNDAGAADDLDPIHIGLDRYGFERPAPRHAVAVRLEPHRLVLVDLRRLRYERIEGLRRQGQGRLPVLFEPLANRLRLAGHHVVPPGQSARLQVGIQLRQVLHPGHGRGPVPLQIVDAVLHVGLLVASRRHAEPWIEAVVARQGRVPRLDFALAALQDGRRHRRGIVPPDLPRHAAEDREPLDHSGQDRLDLLARQRHRKAMARMAPRQQQYRDLLPSIGEVHVDVAEVRLQTPARRMDQR